MLLVNLQSLTSGNKVQTRNLNTTTLWTHERFFLLNFDIEWFQGRKENLFINFCIFCSSHNWNRRNCKVNSYFTHWQMTQVIYFVRRCYSQQDNYVMVFDSFDREKKSLANIFFYRKCVIKCWKNRKNVHMNNIIEEFIPSLYCPYSMKEKKRYKFYSLSLNVFI